MFVHLIVGLLFLAAAGLSTAAESKSDYPPSDPRSYSYPAPVSDDKVRLVFIRDNNTECEMALWNPYTTQVTQLASSPTCPKDLFVADGIDSIFVADKGVIREIQFNPRVLAKAAIPLPRPNFEKHQYKAKNQAVMDYVKKYASERNTRPVAAGRLEDGKLAVVIRTHFPADDSYNFLYGLYNGTWVLLDEMYCNRFATCKFQPLNGRGAGLWEWRDERRIWHNYHLSNPLVVNRRDLSNPQNQTVFGHKALTFNINGQESVLIYGTDPGPDTGTPLTFAIALEIGDQPRVILTDQQCEASLAHKYLLLQRFWGGGLELIDLETVDSIFGKLKAATWIN